MHQLITFAILLAFLPSAHGYQHILQGGVSPNRQYAVYAVDTHAGKPSALAYVVVARGNGAVVARLSSSYEDSSNSFDRQHTDSAVVTWSADGGFVAIDEDVHRYIGELFLVRVSRRHATPIDLNRQEIENAAHQPWDRVSVHQPEWISRRKLGVYLHGLVPGVAPDQLVHKEYDVTLEIGSDNVVRVRSLHERHHDA